MLKSFLIGFSAIILLPGGFKIDRDKNVDRAKFQFAMRDDAELFLRNVRQSITIGQALMAFGKPIVLSITIMVMTGR